MAKKKKKKGNKSSLGETIFGIIFIIWFIASFVFMLLPIGGKDAPLYQVMVFGQYFFVFGLIFFIKAGEIVGLIPIVIGFIVFIIPFGIIMDFSLFKTIGVEYFIIFLALLAFWSVGIGMMIVPMIKRWQVAKRCTVEIMGTIVLNPKSKSESYVVEYEYNGVKKYWKELYPTSKYYEIGSGYVLYLNPKQPSEVVSMKKTFDYYACIGMGFVFSAVVSIIAYLFLFH